MKKIIVKKDISMQEEMNAINASFRDKFNSQENEVVASGSTNYWIVDTYDIYLIVEDNKDGDYFKVPYIVSGDDYTFSPKSDWVQVERKYMETASKKELIVHKGGPGSGHHGHPGLSGVWGGSRPSGAPDKGGGGPPKKAKKKKVSKPKAKPKKTQGDIVEEDFQRAISEASTFEDLPEEAQETIREHWRSSAEAFESRGYVEDVSASEYGKGEPAAPGGLPRLWTLRGTDEGEHRSVKIRETDFGHMLQAISGETIVETEYLDYDFSPGAQTGAPGFGKMSSPGYVLGVALGDYGFFLTYGESPSGYTVHEPEENKEFIEEKCGTPKKKKAKYGDNIIGKKKDEDEDEED